jgi:hypothetical protein
MTQELQYESKVYINGLQVRINFDTATKKL